MSASNEAALQPNEGHCDYCDVDWPLDDTPMCRQGDCCRVPGPSNRKIERRAAQTTKRDLEAKLSRCQLALANIYMLAKIGSGNVLDGIVEQVEAGLGDKVQHLERAVSGDD